MFNAPACVDALEARLATNVSISRQATKSGFSFFIVETKSHFYEGWGRTPETAVHDFLVRNHLEKGESIRAEWMHPSCWID